jgi:hypothetical protein
MTPTFGNPSGGEQLDRAARDSIKLAHEALDRFPEMVRRHKFIAGGAAISSSLIVLAGVAIARRILSGQTPEEAVASVTEEEVQGLSVVEVPSHDGDAPAEALSEVDIEEAAGNGEAETLLDGAGASETAPDTAHASRVNGAP